MKQPTSPWRPFALISLGIFASLLDLFIVNIAFPDIRRDLHATDLAALSWVLNGYAIVLAALLVPAGRLADLFGRKRAFTLGLALFTLASAACALAPAAEWLIAARLIQGVGTALLTPSSLGLVLPAFPPERRAAAIAAWAAVGAVGAAAGPPLGGLLVQADWRWVFLINLPLGVICLWYVVRRIDEYRDPEAAGMPDLVGTVALMLGIGSLTLALVKGRAWGWTGASTVFAFGAAAVLVTLAVVRSARHRVPALELPLLRIPSFALAVASAFTFFIAFASMLLASVLFLTEVWGHSILRAGLELAPGPTLAAVFAAVASRLGPRFGMAALGAVGGLLLATGMAVTAALMGATPDYVGTFLPGQIIGGAGVGMAMPAFTAVAVQAVGPARVATAIGVSSMFRQVGAALGVAALVAILGAGSTGSALPAFRQAWTFMAVTAAAGGLLMLAARLVPVRRPSLMPERQAA